MRPPKRSIRANASSSVTSEQRFPLPTGAGRKYRLTVLGCGRLNLGLVVPLFEAAGFQVYAVNFRDRQVVTQLNRAKHYAVIEAEGNKEPVKRLVDVAGAFHFDSDAPDSRGNEPSLRAAVESNIIISALGTDPGAQLVSTSFLQRFLSMHAAEQRGPLDILEAGNPVGRSFATAVQKTYLLNRLANDVDRNWSQRIAEHMELRLRFPLVLPDRICARREMENGVVKVVVEPFKQLIASAGSHYLQYVSDRLPAAPITITTDIESHRIMKLGLFSCGHALAAYLGALRGMETVGEAMAHDEIAPVVDGAVRQVAEALKRRGGVPPHQIDDYAKSVSSRVQNPALKDLITRVARDPVRKLGRFDRLFGSAFLVLYNSFHVSDELARGAAAALAYTCRNGQPDVQAQRLKQRIFKVGLRAALYELWGLPTAEQTCAKDFERLFLDRVGIYFRRFMC